MWWYVAAFVVGLILAISYMPKPQVAKPAGFGDVVAPTAEEGREISVLFGTRDMRGPNVVWYGDFRSVALKSKGKK